MYIEELSRSNFMEIMSSMAISLGSLLLYLLSTLSRMSFYNLALIQIGISLGYLLLVIGIPETPLWVLWKLKDKEVTIAILKSLCSLRNEGEIKSQYMVVESLVADISIGLCQKIKFILSNKYVLIFAPGNNRPILSSSSTHCHSVINWLVWGVCNSRVLLLTSSCMLADTEVEVHWLSTLSNLITSLCRCPYSPKNVIEKRTS